ncbi:helix-turn-helix domain-containing protein [Nocardioides alcanivorans]|uniref:helix-turn-helix domain-containing protein n=1 Tax=Nocardioides alcanivorans TaxID=2897352 RepID=UPI001F489C83|nr:helix-turn-helix domain-containing protein [Nocardioides alcanivorans]
MPDERIDPDEPAHLRDATGASPPIHRYAPAADLTSLVRRHWIPVWSLPEGKESVQRVLQYPVCLLAIDAERAALVGPTRGLGTRRLSGSGWTFGVLLQPATGWLLLQRPVTEVTDDGVPLETLAGIDGAGLARAVRDCMADDPGSESAQRSAAGHVEEQLRRLLPVDDEGMLVNRIVEFTEARPDVRRVAQVCAEFGLPERSLQRLTARRLGLTPKWLIQRRRLHEAAQRLRQRSTAFDLAAVAADLGYADQAHFIRDFTAVTGLTPGRFASEPRAYDARHE